MVIDEVIGPVTYSSSIYIVPQDAVLNIHFYRTKNEVNYPSTIKIQSINYGNITDIQTIIDITGQVCKSGTKIEIDNFCVAHITGFTVE